MQILYCTTLFSFLVCIRQEASYHSRMDVTRVSSDISGAGVRRVGLVRPREVGLGQTRPSDS